ncbi:5-oxoprolinase subunit C family protein [Rubeoparvulum massiliense]|uniref:5-oxoprolinase subunit C family protein n=1 Tax=Rubeoparvulum massiliense TaxID=1631346 RepID=UPI00065E2E40|nr:biotin-dependent carboxyltransferase family protein [Rubeoparvulum massiliense]
MKGIRITKSGLLTTIQDLGRLGYQSRGVNASGAMDTYAMKLANLLVGNNEQEAVLEMTLIGAHMVFEEERVVALTGANMSPTLNHQKVELGMPITVKVGDELRLKSASTGCRTYLAVQGGFALPDVLNSKSTSLKAKIGGFQGRPLEVGDVLLLQRSSHSTTHLNWKLSPWLFHYMDEEMPIIRYIQGRQYHWFTEETHQLFNQASFTISPQSDRMGYRLEGPPLQLKVQQELLTEGTAFGTIQVPPNGQPIILMADRQPTGGYPKIGNVIQVDLPKLSQLPPGRKLRFQEVSIQEAQQLLRQQDKLLRCICRAIRLKKEEYGHVSG